MTSSSIDISRLAPEILLCIFSKLDSNQATVVMRRVCRDWLQVIDNNQLLWRIFEWTQQDKEPYGPALDMFDEKSRSTLEEVSIRMQYEDESEDSLLDLIQGEDIPHLVQVLTQSRNTLKHVTLHDFNDPEFGPFLDLLSSSSRLRTFIDWSGELPVSRLVPSNRKVSTSSDRSSTRGLELLWVFGYSRTFSNPDNQFIKSLISFSQFEQQSPEVCRALVANFSDNIIHLRISVGYDHSRTIVPIFCPELKVLEGYFGSGASAFVDAQNLQILVLAAVENNDLQLLPSSLEEIWILANNVGRFDNVRWEPLLRSCPKLKILKLTEAFMSPDDPFEHKLDVLGFLKFLEERKTRAQDGEVTDGIRMIPIQKLILPTHLLSQDELIRARDAVEEVVDVKDYREIIEIEY